MDSFAGRETRIGEPAPLKSGSEKAPPFAKTGSEKVQPSAETCSGEAPFSTTAAMAQNFNDGFLARLPRGSPAYVLQRASRPSGRTWSAVGDSQPSSLIKASMEPLEQSSSKLGSQDFHFGKRDTELLQQRLSLFIQRFYSPENHQRLTEDASVHEAHKNTGEIVAVELRNGLTGSLLEAIYVPLSIGNGELVGLAMQVVGAASPDYFLIVIGTNELDQTESLLNTLTLTSHPRLTDPFAIVTIGIVQRARIPFDFDKHQRQHDAWLANERLKSQWRVSVGLDPHCLAQPPEGTPEVVLGESYPLPVPRCRIQTDDMHSFLGRNPRSEAPPSTSGHEEVLSSSFVKTEFQEDPSSTKIGNLARIHKPLTLSEFAPPSDRKTVVGLPLEDTYTPETGDANSWHNSVGTCDNDRPAFVEAGQLAEPAPPCRRGTVDGIPQVNATGTRNRMGQRARARAAKRSLSLDLPIQGHDGSA
jgi:hypothetical protein